MHVARRERGGGSSRRRRKKAKGEEEEEAIAKEESNECLAGACRRISEGFCCTSMQHSYTTPRCTTLHYSAQHCSALHCCCYLLARELVRVPLIASTAPTAVLLMSRCGRSWVFVCDRRAYATTTLGNTQHLATHTHTHKAHTIANSNGGNTNSGSEWESRQQQEQQQ